MAEVELLECFLVLPTVFATLLQNNAVLKRYVFGCLQDERSQVLTTTGLVIAVRNY